MNLTELAREIHADNVAAGWWPDEDKSKRYDTCLMLIVSELAEATEGDRKNLMDHHLPDLPMFQVELADAAIRLLDLAGAVESHNDWPLGSVARADQQAIKNNLRRMTCPEQLLLMTRTVVDASYLISNRCTNALTALLILADIHEFDLLAVIERKREYNRTRVDHSAAARAAENGKRY